jgi:cytidine deaminase
MRHSDDSEQELDQGVGPKVEDAVRETWDQQGWDDLRSAATEVMQRAYAPYSRYRVGAAARVDDGRVVVGCNVENAAYGVVLCAECGLVSQLYATGGGRLTHFVCVNGEGEIIMPCGRCRQLLFEHGGRDLLVWTVSGVKPMTEVLPDAFGPDDLAHVAGAAVEGDE